MYLNGRGVPQDYREALKWLLLAAEQEDSLAYQKLGFMHANGLGVPLDRVQALYWFALAVLKGGRETGSNVMKELETLAAQFSVKERTIALEAAQKCKSAGYNYTRCSPPIKQELLGIPAAVLAQELSAYKTTATNAKMQIEAGIDAFMVNVAGKQWKVTKNNLAAFLDEMQSAIDELSRAAEHRGYPKIAGRYSLKAQSECKGGDSDISGIFASVGSGGERSLLKEVIVEQTGLEAQLVISNEPQRVALPAIVIQDALIVGNLGFEPFNLWGTIKGPIIELRYDEQQLKTLYGADSASEADWHQVRTCFVTLTLLK